MAEWSEDHVAVIGSSNLNFGLVNRTWLNCRLDGPLGGKWRPLIGKIGECDMESQHLQGCSPRLCRLSTDGLGPASKY
jgi:hypothetical protein